jgi:hypothetical protein
MLQKFIRNKNISKELKLRLNYTIMYNTLTYASETWMLTGRGRKEINIFLKGKYRKF